MKFVVFVIFNSKKMSFSLILILVICYDLFLLLTTKVDERKRNETRFDTITVSLKAIWLVLGSWFFVFYLTSAAHLCRTRVFVFSFFTCEKYLLFHNYF